MTQGIDGGVDLEALMALVAVVTRPRGKDADAMAFQLAEVDRTVRLSRITPLGSGAPSGKAEQSAEIMNTLKQPAASQC